MDDDVKKYPLEPYVGMYVCLKCGCADVEGTEWVYLNHDTPAGGDPPDNTIWCPYCDDHYSRVAMLDEKQRNSLAVYDDEHGPYKPFTLDMERWEENRHDEMLRLKAKELQETLQELVSAHAQGETLQNMQAILERAKEALKESGVEDVA